MADAPQALAFPLCDGAADGDTCFWTAPSGKGSVLYDDYSDCARRDLLLPGFELLPDWILAIAYGLALVWAFFGVAIISDTFMSSIEVITSAERTATRKDRRGNAVQVTVTVWNATVANLTLMALGSSAPEIMLAVIETCTTLGKPPGELGPSTIVGSAAFNLFVISAVCIIAVPDGQHKAISDFGVFVVTAIWSLWAYAWMLIVYKFWTPDQVTAIEAWATLAMMPLFVGMAYTADRRPWRTRAPVGDSLDEDRPCYQVVLGATAKTEDQPAVHLNMDQVQHHMHPRLSQRRSQSGTQQDYGSGLTTMGATHTKFINNSQYDPEGADMRLADEDKPSTGHLPRASVSQLSEGWPMSALQYKMNARHALTGRSFLATEFRSKQGGGPLSDAPEPLAAAAPAVLSFRSEHYVVGEDQETVILIVACVRDESARDATISCKYATRDGDAAGGADYEVTTGSITFPPGVDSQLIRIRVFTDDEVEDDEDFFVDLHSPDPSNAIFQHATTTVTVVDATECGNVGFSKAVYTVAHPQPSAELSIVRKHGSSGPLQVGYCTQDRDALAGQDYCHTKGVLTFQHGECDKAVTVPLGAGQRVGTAFSMFLTAESESIVRKRRAACEVRIVDEVEVSPVEALVADMVDMKPREQERGEYLQQFWSAVTPGGEVDSQGRAQEPSASDIILHYLSITWKVMFATVPPPAMGGGWPCFVVSLLFIGGVTYFVGEIANLFGCAVGLSNEMTAVVFVALGTSLPDTFASRQAAQQMDDADAAIGNITGSNSVNVFLGLGIPWVIATLYYGAKGEKYLTPAGPLSFSVLVYMAFALVCLCVLFAKRKLGGELGGHGIVRTGSAAALIGLWLVYIVLSGLQSTDKIPSPF